MKQNAMHRFFTALIFLAAVSGAAIPFPALSQGQSLALPSTQKFSKKTRQVDISLIADKATVRPGDTVTVAVRQKIALGWHTYWRNPGDAGEPTVVEWSLPSGAKASELQWPLPEIIAVEGITDYGYSGEVLLLSDIALPKDLSAPAIEIKAHVQLLVCKDICVPEEASASLSLFVDANGGPSQNSPNAKQIADVRNTLPAPSPWPARFEVSGETVTLRLENFQQKLLDTTKLRLYPGKPNVIENSPPQLAVAADGALALQMRRSTAKLPLPKRFEGVLAVETPAGESGDLLRLSYSVSGEVKQLPGNNAFQEVKTSPKAQQPNVEQYASGKALSDYTDWTKQPAQPSGIGNISFVTAAAFAFLGGLILNLMPCVFPVLSLKALSLARETAPHERHIHASAYLLGVLLSFAILAAGLIILRAGGEQIGWGTQFQSPTFVLILMALFMALGLNMSGVFEIGGRLAGIGDKLTRAPGFTGYFFTGVLATVVATPCTAPFMGAAVGYAFTQPSPLRLLAVLLVLGIGFALPMVALSYLPAVGRWLPKPGPWMSTFKGALAFPLYATAGWLLWVLSVQAGSVGVLGGLVVLLGVAFAAWLIGLTQAPSPLRSGAAVAIALAAIWGGMLLLSASSNETANANAAPAMQTQTEGALTYETFSVARLEALRAERKPVFVNLTAAWCITCKVNERVALNSSRISEAFAARGIMPLKGDWSKANPEITAMLQKFGRAGVPLYLLYPADGGEPQVFPQILTESIVLDRLAKIPLKRQAKSERK